MVAQCLSPLWLTFPLLPQAARAASNLCSQFQKKFFLLLFTQWTQIHPLIFIFSLLSFQNELISLAIAVAHAIAPSLLHSKLCFVSSSFPSDCECWRAGTESYYLCSNNFWPKAISSILNRHWIRPQVFFQEMFCAFSRKRYRKLICPVLTCSWPMVQRVTLLYESYSGFWQPCTHNILSVLQTFWTLLSFQTVLSSPFNLVDTLLWANFDKGIDGW